MKRKFSIIIIMLLLLSLFAGSPAVYAEETGAETEPAVTEALEAEETEDASESVQDDADAEEVLDAEEATDTEEALGAEESAPAITGETEAVPEDASVQEEEAVQPDEETVLDLQEDPQDPAAGETGTEQETPAVEEPETPAPPAFDAKTVLKLRPVKNSTDGVALSWKAVKGAAGYIVYRKTAKGTWKQYAKVTARKYTDTKVKPGRTYSYRVRAFGATGRKGKFDKKGRTIIYCAPVNRVKASNTKNSDVLIKWDAVKAAGGYRIMRRTAGGSFKKLADVGKKVTSFTDSSAVSGTAYEYIIKTYKKADKRKYFSAYYSEKTAALIKVARGRMGSAVPQENKILVTWKKVKGATGYELFRREAGGKWASITKTAERTYTDSSVTAGVKYYYRVRAYVEADGKTTYSVRSKTVSAAFSDVEAMAAEQLKAVGGTLRDAYNWAVKIPYSDQPEVFKTSEYAKWSFEHGAGDCLGKSAVFVIMGRQLGYEMKLMYGYVPRRGGGMTDHGWVEVKDGDTWYVCDPDFEYESGKNGYFINYGQSGTWMYTDYRELPY